MSNILLIEPDVVLAKTYKQALEAAGHMVVCSSNAQESIIAMDAKRPDLVILELRLAGHNGVEFLYELRSYTDWQNIPVIAHTMVSSSAFKIDWKSLGVWAYLYKPKTTLAKLRQTVDIVLHES